MRLGINTFLFTSPFTNDSTKLFKQFKQWGAETIEIPIEDPSHIDPAHVKRELDKLGLVCGSVCACLGPDRDLRGTPKQQKDGLDYMKKVIDQMVVLDCPSLIGPVYSSVGRADAVPPAEYKKQWKTVVKNLKTLAAYAQKRGKQICMEPLNRFETDFINTCDQALKMVKAVGSSTSGCSGGSYGALTPVKSRISPARALAYSPLESRCSQTSTGIFRYTSTNWPGGRL